MEQAALIHSEVSEAVEEYRQYGTLQESMIYFVDDKPCGLAIEMADALLRICNTCERFQIPLEMAVEMKMEYNKSRPARHGGKIES
jgi:NTP pyrophosphatase (non-canonical NTP hydrolase)